MNKNFIDQLIGFLGTPFGIIGIAIGLLMAIGASRNRQTGWLLFSCCCFAASLGTFQSIYIPIAPRLVFPLEQIRLYGRPLAIILLILLVLLALQTKGNWRRAVIPKAVDYLIFVQFIIFSKTIMYGSIEFAIISAITFGGIIFMFKRGPGLWLHDDENFHMAARSIAIAILIFIVANGYQYLVNSSAVTFIGGRFTGTTINPQVAGLLLSATIPCLMFMIQSSPSWNFAKSCWAIVVVIMLYFLLLTGSRTGLLMAAASILLFYRNNGGAWVRIGFVLLILSVLILPFVQSETFSASSVGLDSAIGDRYASMKNTRQDVWSGMWISFSENILFGSPLQGDRLGYGESSWLGAGASLGLLGFIPTVLVGWESLKMMWQLDRLSNRNSYYFIQSSTVIAGLGSTLVGSFFEAFLLGNITFALFLFLIYLVMGAYLLEVDKFRTHYARSEAEVVNQQSGVYQ